MAKSTEIGRAGADRVTRSLSGISSGGILVTAWWKILDPGAAPWSRGNYEIFSLLAPNWLIRGIVGNATVDAAGIGALNCNTMLFTGSGYSYTDYIGDFSFYSGGAGGLTQAQLKDWNWVAWWIQPGATFTMRQWLRVSGSGGVFLATDGGTDVSTDARLASATDPPTDLTWATNYDVPQSNGYLWHPTVRAQATSPTLAQLDALALATAPDATAWADWPFEAPSGVLNHNDQSGNGRTLSDASPGTTTFYEGPDSPAPQLDNVYMGASTIAYSATNPTPDYSSLPSPLAANDLILLVVGQKPSTANSGTVTTPTGYTLLTSLTGAGGYGATLGADTGNTNIFVYQKTSVSGTESGTITVTTGTNNVAFAYFAHFRSSNGLYDIATATTSQTTGGNVSLAFGAINVAALDWLLAAMVIPTDVTTPSQFSVEAFAGTGLTMGPTVELNEPDSTTNNDIGGMSCAGPVTAASGSTAVTLTATAGGTTTNVRGPGVLIRVRRATSSSSASWHGSDGAVRYISTKRPIQSVDALPPQAGVFTGAGPVVPARVARASARKVARPDDGLPPMAAVVAAPSPIDAAAARRRKPALASSPQDQALPQLGVFTGTGPVDSPPLAKWRLRAVTSGDNGLPPVVSAAAPPAPADAVVARRIVPRVSAPQDQAPPLVGAATGSAPVDFASPRRWWQRRQGPPEAALPPASTAGQIALAQDVTTFGGASPTSVAVNITAVGPASILHIIVIGTNASTLPVVDISGVSGVVTLQQVYDTTSVFVVTAHFYVAVAPGAYTITANYTDGASTPLSCSDRGILVREIINAANYLASAAQNQPIPAVTADAITTGSTSALTAQPALASAVSYSTFDPSGTPVAGSGYTQAGTFFPVGGTDSARAEQKRVTATTALAGTFTSSVANVNRYNNVVAVFAESGTEVLGVLPDNPPPTRFRRVLARLSLGADVLPQAGAFTGSGPVDSPAASRAARRIPGRPDDNLPPVAAVAGVSPPPDAQVVTRRPGVRAQIPQDSALPPVVATTTPPLLDMGSVARWWQRRARAPETQVPPPVPIVYGGILDNAVVRWWRRRVVTPLVEIWWPQTIPVVSPVLTPPFVSVFDDVALTADFGAIELSAAHDDVALTLEEKP